MFGFGIVQILKGYIQTGSGRVAAAGCRPGLTSPDITTGGTLTTSSHQF